MLELWCSQLTAWKWFHACLTFFRGSYVQLTLKVKAQQDASESEETSIWCFFFLNMSSLSNSNRESQDIVHCSHCKAHWGDVIVILGNITEIDLIWWVWKTSHFQDLFWFFFLLHVPTHPSSRRFAPTKCYRVYVFLNQFGILGQICRNRGESIRTDRWKTKALGSVRMPTHQRLRSLSN